MVSDPDPIIQAVEQIYRQHSAFVWRMAKTRGVPEHSIPDLLQEVFISILEKFPSYHEEGRIRGWIYRIADNHILMYFRKDGRARRRMDAYANAHDVYSKHDSGPDDIVFRNQASLIVQSFLSTISDETREEFFLCCIEGIPVSEAASMLRVNVNTLYGRISALRRRFAEFVLQHRPQAEQRHE
nr:sigma-70 family RNA polymerase sigma factor [Nannocystis pusilla]